MIDKDDENDSPQSKARKNKFVSSWSHPVHCLGNGKMTPFPKGAANRARRSKASFHFMKMVLIQKQSSRRVL